MNGCQPRLPVASPRQRGAPSSPLDAQPVLTGDCEEHIAYRRWHGGEGRGEKEPRNLQLSG